MKTQNINAMNRTNERSFRSGQRFRLCVAAASFMLAWLAANTSYAADAPAAVTSRIDAVTVYADRALVRRVGRHVLNTSGDIRLRLTELPAKLDDGSVRLVVGGTARPTLIGFSVDTISASEEVSPEARALESEIRALEHKDQTLDGEYRQVGDQRGFLTSIRSSFDPKLLKRTGAEKLDTKSWQAAEEYVGTELDRLLVEARRIASARRTLGKELLLLRKKLEAMRGKRGTSTKAVTFDLKTAKSGSLTLTLRYLVPDVSWRSLYDARLAGAQVTLTHYAVVTQETGEDWTDVRLSVSTAAAGQRVRLTRLATRNLGVGYHAPGYGGPMGGAERTITTSKNTTEKKEKEKPLPPPPAAEAEVRQSEFVTTFDAATRVAIPSSPAGRKTALANHTWPVVIEHVAVPSRAQGAYMTARGRLSGTQTLPAGEVNLFFVDNKGGAELIGQTHLATVAGGSELRLPFGRDERVKVRRVIAKSLRDTKGVFSKKERQQRRFEIHVENQSGKPLELLVMDQHPVAQHSDIEVALDEDTTPRAPVDPTDGAGVLRWMVKLAPGATEIVRLGYTVSYPAHRRVYGM